MATRIEELREKAREKGLYLATYSPGDGVTRYRFFRTPSGYFGPENGIYTALGLKEAYTYLAGVRGHERSRPGHPKGRGERKGIELRLTRRSGRRRYRGR